MNNYRINRESNTFGSDYINGILASQILAELNHVEQYNEQHQYGLSTQDFYHRFATPATFDHCRTLIKGEYPQARNEFELSITQCYAGLLANQEALGAEFEKVLFKNLWDLYES